MTTEMLERLWAANLEVRAAEGRRPTLVGYAALFNVETERFDDFFEKIAPGSFTRTLKENPDVFAFAQHDQSRVIGRTKAGTLELREDKKGLLATITPPNTTLGNDIIEDVRSGNIDGLSIGFLAVKASFEIDGRREIRTLEDVDLVEISVVTMPQFEDATVSVRSRDVWRNALHLATETRMRRLRLAEVGR